MENRSMNYLEYSLEETWDSLKEYRAWGILSEDMEKEMFGYMDDVRAEIKRRNDAGIVNPENWCDKDAEEYWDCQCPTCNVEISWEELEDKLIKGMGHDKAFEFVKTSYLSRKIEQFFMEDEYSPSNPVDLEYYLMERIWNKVMYRCTYKQISLHELRRWIDDLYHRCIIGPQTHFVLQNRIENVYDEMQEYACNQPMNVELMSNW